MIVKLLIIFSFLYLPIVASEDENKDKVVVISMNCCAEGFSDYNHLDEKGQYDKRIKAFTDFVKTHTTRQNFIIGLQEIVPFEDGRVDLSDVFHRSLLETGVECTRFLCHDLFTDHYDQLGGTAVITNLPTGTFPGQFMLPNGQSVCPISVHLTDVPAQLCSLTGVEYDGDPGSPITTGKGGKTVAQIVAERSARKAENFYQFVEKFSKDQPNLVLVGDFNEPSHADWLEGERDEGLYGSFGHIPHVIEWPCTRVLESFGFVDALRSIHPRPSMVRGYTYPSSAPIPVFGPPSRIDHILVRGGTITDFETVDTDLSDHKFVKSVMVFPK